MSHETIKTINEAPIKSQKPISNHCTEPWPIIVTKIGNLNRVLVIKSKSVSANIINFLKKVHIKVNINTPHYLNQLKTIFTTPISIGIATIYHNRIYGNISTFKILSSINKILSRKLIILKACSCPSASPKS